MHELLWTLVAYAKSAWRFRWIGVAVAVGVAAAGWVAVAMMPDRFVAQARVYVDTSSQIGRVLSGQIADSSFEQELQFVRESLLGRPQLERLARAADLDLEVKDEQELAALVESLRASISISIAPVMGGYRGPAGGGNIYSIEFRDRDRGISVTVVKSLLDIFMEDTLGAQRATSEVSSSFLKDQIEDYQRRLREADRRIADFNRQHAERMPGMQGGYFQRLQLETSELGRAREQLNLAASKLESINRQLRGEAGQPVVDSEASPTGPIDLRIRSAEQALEDLHLRFTEQHPDVVALEEMLADLKAQRENQLQEIASGEIGFASSNPVLQALQIAKNETEAEVATLRADVRARETSIANLRGLIDELPNVEADLANLTRDYTVLNQQYQNLLASSERDQLTRNAQQSESIQFRIIDPPNAPLDPTDPNRAAFMLMVILISLGAGGAVAFLLSQARPVFVDAQSLTDETGLVVLGTVGRSTTLLENSSQRRDLLAFLASIAALLAVYGSVMAFELIGGGLRGIF
jgi:polysaccharide chain length determinant protein (PEP-CTERM system associated)